MAEFCLWGAATRLQDSAFCFGAKYLLQIFTDGAKVPSVIEIISKLTIFIIYLSCEKATTFSFIKIDRLIIFYYYIGMRIIVKGVSL